MAVEPTTQKPIHSLILDTGPLIKNVVSISTIINSAEELYTTPAIISEIRDEATRMRVQTTLMPFLKVRNPSPASYDAVIAFSKKTGDHAVLSRQDLGILALAYEIHCERNGGDWGLRSVPKGPIKLRPEEEEEARKQKEAKDAARAAQEQAKLENGQVEEEDEWATVTKSKKSRKSKGPNKKNTKPEETKEEEAQTEMILEQPETEAEPQEKPEEPVAQDASQEQATCLPAEEKPVEVENTSESTQQAADAATGSVSIEQGLSSLDISCQEPQQEPTPPASDDEDDNDGEWITETNLPEHQVKDTTLQANVRTQGPTQMDVATMTIDFAMQNVLLQMNLKLITTNMQRIKKLSSKVLRCHACFQIVKDMSKQFCPRCGGATLARVSCSTNAKGEFHIHLAKNYVYNKRGDKFSIPKPIAGTANTKWTGIGGGKGGWGRDLILAEDQKEYTKQLEKGKREKASDLMDQDYLPGILTGDRGRAGGRVKVGAGKNVNGKNRR